MVCTRDTALFVPSTVGQGLRARSPHEVQKRRGRRYNVAPARMITIPFHDKLLISFDQFARAVIVSSILTSMSVKFGRRYLTRDGSLHAGALMMLLWCSLGFPGFSLGALFFIIGNYVTKLGKEIKLAEGTYEKRAGARGPANVWGAAGIASIFAMLVLFSPVFIQSKKVLAIIKLLSQLGFTAAVATKTFDTIASEIGKAFGKTTILPTTLKVVPRGTEGAISLEGTLAGLAGAALISAYAWFAFLIPYLDIPVCIAAAFLGNLVESIVGSTVQEKWKLTNEAVNVINTGAGAFFAISIRLLLTYFNIFY